MSKSSIATAFIALLLLLFLSTLPSESATIYTADLTTQPPADDSDCWATIDSTLTGWIGNGFVKVSFNTTSQLQNITFYRGSQKILMLDMTNSYLNYSEAGGSPSKATLTFYKIQYYVHNTNGWQTWSLSSPIPDNYFAYRQQIIIRAIWQDAPTPTAYRLIGIFRVTRGMPFVQVEWQITNYMGAQFDWEFVPNGLFYVTTTATVLNTTQNLVWGNVANYIYNNPWAETAGIYQYAKYFVGYTLNGSATANPLYNKLLQLHSADYYQNASDVFGHWTRCNWSEDFSASPYEYNYTFYMDNDNTTSVWSFAELWIPQGLENITFYYSTDGGSTWNLAMWYNFTLGSGGGSGFQSVNGTSISGALYNVSIAGGSGAAILASVPTKPSTYNYSSYLGVYDRIALGLKLGADDSDSSPPDGSDEVLVKVQIQFTGTARYWFDYSTNQYYGLKNANEDWIWFFHDTTTGYAWGIGMNQTLRHFRVTSRCDKTLANVLFSWNETLKDQESGAFTMNVLAYPNFQPAIDRDSDLIYDYLDPTYLTSYDYPLYQTYEAAVITTFNPLQYWVGTDANNRQVKFYILSWSQRNTSSTYEPSIALVNPSKTTNGWNPTTTPTWRFVRTGSPNVKTFDSTGMSQITFQLTYTYTPPSGGAPSPAPSPSEEAEAEPSGIFGIILTPTGRMIIVAIIIVLTGIYFYATRRS